MCEWLQKYFNSVARGLCDPFEISGIKQNMCPGCGKYLTPQFLRPSDRCSRAWCDDCFNRLFVSRILEECGVCRTPIPGKVELQKQQRREIEYKLCGRPECDAAIARIFAAVNGVDKMMRNQMQGSQHHQAIPAQVFPADDVMGGEYIDHGPKNAIEFNPYSLDSQIRREAQYVAPRIEDFIKQLPEPEPQLRVPDFYSSDLEPVPVSRGSRTRDDGVIVVDLTKQKGK